MCSIVYHIVPRFYLIYKCAQFPTKGVAEFDKNNPNVVNIESPKQDYFGSVITHFTERFSKELNSFKSNIPNSDKIAWVKCQFIRGHEIKCILTRIGTCTTELWFEEPWKDCIVGHY